MPIFDVNPNTIRVKTAAQWAIDNTIYSERTILISSDEFYTGTDQRKFKIADGVQTWSNLDYFPDPVALIAALTLSTVISQGSSTGDQRITSNDTQSYIDLINNSIGIWLDKGATFAGIDFTGTFLDLQHSSRLVLNAPQVRFQQLTALRLLATDGNKDAQALSTTTYPDLTELSYVKGATSSLQTQINNLVSQVVGVLDFQSDLDCSANPNYPSATQGWCYYVSVAGKVGGASGKSVEVGDLLVAKATNAGGTEAAVGASWFVLEHNLVGALVASNNLSDLTNAGTARNNLGGTTIGQSVFTLTNPSAVSFPRFNADNSTTARTAAELLDDIDGKKNTGVTNASDAASGIVGEVLSQSRLRSAATALTTATPANVLGTALTLPAGDWDVTAHGGFLAGTGTSLTVAVIAVSLTSATLPATDTTSVPTNGEIRMQNVPTASGVILATNGAFGLNVPTFRISINTPTTYYLVSQANFTVGTLSIFGSIYARRVR